MPLRKSTRNRRSYRKKLGNCISKSDLKLRADQKKVVKHLDKHDKLLVVDGSFPDKAMVMTGGRNVSLDYYGITEQGEPDYTAFKDMEINGLSNWESKTGGNEKKELKRLATANKTWSKIVSGKKKAAIVLFNERDEGLIADHHQQFVKR